jgi:hypothetical protein
LNKSSSDTTHTSPNGIDKKRNGSLNNNHHKSSRRSSENNLELNHSTNGHRSKIQKPKVIRSPSHSSSDRDTSASSSSSESVSQKITTNDLSHKPIREAKKRSLIYTGNTREFLETAIAAGLIDANGDEDDDNEYVPPGGKVTRRPQPSTSSSDNEEEEDEEDEGDQEESNRGSDDNNEEDDEEDEEVGSGDEAVANEEPSESGINWNVRNRPQRQSHLIRFDAISKQDGQIIFPTFLFHIFLYFRTKIFRRITSTNT